MQEGIMYEEKLAILMLVRSSSLRYNKRFCQRILPTNSLCCRKAYHHSSARKSKLSRKGIYRIVGLKVTGLVGLQGEKIITASCGAGNR
jgi:hypothetical protein